MNNNLDKIIDNYYSSLISMQLYGAANMLYKLQKRIKKLDRECEMWADRAREETKRADELENEYSNMATWLDECRKENAKLKKSGGR